MKRMRSVSTIIAAWLVMGTIAGCGADAQKADQGNDSAKASSQENDAEKENAKDEAAGGGKKDGAQGSDGNDDKKGASATNAKELLGEWQFVYSKSKTDYKDGTSYDGFTMGDDEYGLDSAIIIRESDGGLCCDYTFNGYEYTERLYGVKLNYLEEAAYPGCDNDKWCYEFSGCFEDEESLRRVTVTDDDMLIVSSKYVYDDADYPEYSSSTINEYRYLKKDDERLKDVDSLRYFDEVKVSNVIELVNSMQSNRRIIVEPGTYNFSKVSSDQIKTARAQNEYGAVNFTDVSNVKIEAAGGGEVLFCIDSAYEPVVTFRNSSHISIEGITAGHNAEPGTCSGSVLSFNDVSGLHITNCKLFGSGTYGIEAYATYDINVSDTDIYECTYGLLDLRSIGNAMFTNCSFRDSSYLSMLSIDNAYDVTFEKCTFTGNRVDSDRDYFVELGEYDSATFRDCTFKDNKFYTFSNREVTLENCKDENNSAKFKDIAKTDEVPDKDSLLKQYDEVKARQKEIDDKIKGDALLDQQSLNQLAYEEYDMWDGLLNRVWGYIVATLDEKDMEELREKQKSWIKEKEAKMKNDARDFEGGSMAPMIEYGSGAEFTQKRVEDLIGTYLK